VKEIEHFVDLGIDGRVTFSVLHKYGMSVWIRLECDRAWSIGKLWVQLRNPKKRRNSWPIA